MSGSLKPTIGIFDSGAGGLSVLREIVRELEHQDVLYFADTAHVPYGRRDVAEIRAFSTAITSFLASQGAAIVVVACNTASAAALSHLRARFDLPIVGMEPAVKPAVEHTHSRQVGVIATEVTFQGELFARLVERFAQDTVVHAQACPGLVQQVEAGRVQDAATEAMLEGYLRPMLDAGIDSLVLGCTHYAFLLPLIQRVAGPAVEVIDPAPAVARQAARILRQRGTLLEKGRGQVTFFASGDPAAFRASLNRLVDVRGPVHGVRWVPESQQFVLAR